MIGELVMRCFHARTAAHVLHLQTRSFAAHKALNEFYDEIVGLADSVAEAWQGEYGLIPDYPGRYSPSKDAEVMLKDLAEWIEENRSECCGAEDTHLQNEIDNIVTLIQQTLYKLRFLK